jgi:tetratricopeptide (TPR) repeat protein
VFWVHGGTRERVEEGYRTIADRVRLAGRNDPKADVLRLVRDWLAREENEWTIIVDNADDVGVFFAASASASAASSTLGRPIASFLPQSRNGSILITSRSMDAAEKLAGSRNIIPVAAMAEALALELLGKKLGDCDAPGSNELVRLLGYMPLAISQAAAYIVRRASRVSVTKYIERFRASDESRESLLNRDSGDLRRDESASNSVVTAWQVTFEQIRRERPTAADLLSFMSQFSPQGIPESMLYGWRGGEVQGGDGGRDDGLQLEDDLDMLVGYSMVTMTEGKELEMHSLVQFCTRVWLSTFGQAECWGRQFVEAMSREFPEYPWRKPDDWALAEKLIPHVELVVTDKPRDDRATEHWATLAANVAWYWRQKGSYGIAEKMARIAIRVVGAEFLTHFGGMVLAVVLDDRGEYEEAEQLSRAALARREEVLGKDHHDTLMGVHVLAEVLRSQAKYEEAKQLHRRALAAREDTLGKEHRDTLSSVGNLASVLQDLGKNGEAEQLNRRALAAREKVLGKEHRDTLTSVANLASVLQELGKYDEAEQLNRRALAGYQRVLGPEHPYTLMSVNNLASVLRAQGKYDKAAQLN